MLNPDIEKSIFELYDNEIDVNSFSSYSTMLKMFLLYKHLLSIESYVYEEEKLKIITLEDNSSHDLTNAKNAIIIGGSPYMEECYNELISMFVSQGIQDDQPKYKIYINPDMRVIHVTRNNSTGYSVFNSYTEKIFCAIATKLFPWYFSAGTEKISKEIAPMFINNELLPKFQLEFEAMVTELGLSDKVLMNKMLKMADRITEKKVVEAERRVKEIEERIRERFESIYNYNMELKQQQNALRSMRMDRDAMHSPVMEIVEFIESSREKISIANVNDETITFEITAMLDQFTEEEDYYSIIRDNNGTSYMFGKLEHCNGDVPKEFIREVYGSFTTEEIKEFYRRIAETNEFKLWTSMKIDLNIVSGRVHAEKVASKNSMPHPHLGAHYSCFGNSETRIAQYSIANRFVEALNQILYAAKQITLSDDAAGVYLLKGVCENKCIELPNGEFEDIAGAIEYIRKEKEAE